MSDRVERFETQANFEGLVQLPAKNLCRLGGRSYGRCCRTRTARL